MRIGGFELFREATTPPYSLGSISQIKGLLEKRRHQPHYAFILTLWFPTTGALSMHKTVNLLIITLLFFEPS